MTGGVSNDGCFDIFLLVSIEEEEEEDDIDFLGHILCMFAVDVLNEEGWELLLSEGGKKSDVDGGEFEFRFTLISITISLF